jgi:hypothetical protein
MSSMNTFVKDNTSGFIDFIACVSTPSPNLMTSRTEWISPSAPIYFAPNRVKASLVSKRAKEGIPLLPHLIDVERNLSLLASIISPSFSNNPTIPSQRSMHARQPPSKNYASLVEECRILSNESVRRAGFVDTLHIRDLEIDPLSSGPMHRSRSARSDNETSNSNKNLASSRSTGSGNLTWPARIFNDSPDTPPRRGLSTSIYNGTDISNDPLETLPRRGLSPSIYDGTDAASISAISPVASSAGSERRTRRTYAIGGSSGSPPPGAIDFAHLSSLSTPQSPPQSPPQATHFESDLSDPFIALPTLIPLSGRESISSVSSAPTTTTTRTNSISSISEANDNTPSLAGRIGSGTIGRKLSSINFSSSSENGESSTSTGEGRLGLWQRMSISSIGSGKSRDPTRQV